MQPRRKRNPATFPVFFSCCAGKPRRQWRYLPAMLLFQFVYGVLALVRWVWRLPVRKSIESSLSGLLPLLLISSALLYFIAHLLVVEDHPTFAVLAARHGWDVQEKAQCCRRAGWWYLMWSIGIIVYRRFLPSRALRRGRHRSEPFRLRHSAGVQPQGSTGISQQLCSVLSGALKKVGRVATRIAVYLPRPVRSAIWRVVPKEAWYPSSSGLAVPLARSHIYAADHLSPTNLVRVPSFPPMSARILPSPASGRISGLGAPQMMDRTGRSPVSTALTAAAVESAGFGSEWSGSVPITGDESGSLPPWYEEVRQSVPPAGPGGFDPVLGRTYTSPLRRTPTHSTQNSLLFVSPLFEEARDGSPSKRIGFHFSSGSREYRRQREEKRE